MNVVVTGALFLVIGEGGDAYAELKRLLRLWAAEKPMVVL